MRRLKLLLLAAVALMGVNVANAQASYNYPYTEGVEVAAGSDLFLYNIGAKRFLDNGMNWGTRATVDNAGKALTLTLDDGKYAINTGVKTRYGGGGGGDYLNGGYTDGAYMTWVFTPVTVAGYTNVYTISDGGGNYFVYQTNAEGDNPACNFTSLSGTNNDYWILVTKAQRQAVKDYTFMLDNTCFNRPWEHKVWTVNITSTGSNGNATPNQSGGKVDNRCAESYRNAFTYLQNATGTVVEGRYKLYNQGFYRMDGGSGAACIYLNEAVEPLKVLNANGENTAQNMDGASTAFSAGQYVNSVEAFVNTGSLTVGIKNDNNMNWVIWNNFYLEYLGQCVMDYAVALPDGGAMEANTWYYFNIAAAADNYTATATTLGDIVCTDDGYTLTSAVTGNVALTEKDNSLAAKRYYVKSLSANKLEIAVADYTYSISEAETDISYIQKDNTVTVSFTCSTNDPSGTLTQNYSGVTFGGESISVTPTASGFTFIVPTVSANTPYTLSIPEGAIKYNDENKNAAQNITLTTPAVFDGVYFLKAAATYNGASEGTSAIVGKYLARGLNYGTHATLDKYGLPVQITTDGNNATTIQAYDTKRYFFHANSWDCYADQASLAASGYFTITVNNGKLLIHNNSMAAGTYLKYNNGAVNDANISVFDDGKGDNDGPIIMWTTEDASSHATVMQSYKDSQAAAAAAAAYASGNYTSLNGITTLSALEAELEANYIKSDFVSHSAIESIQEKYQGNQPGSGNITETVYSNTINITEPGFYKFSMQAFYRAGSNEVTQDMHTNAIDFPPVVLFFGDSEIQIKSIYDDGGLDQGVADGYFETETVGGAPVQYNDKWYTNGQHNSVIIFQKDYYHNDVYFYASEPGEYTYGVKYMGWACANMQWFIYSPESVEITSYAAAATDDDYTALRNAITTVEANYGFEKDDYAPYAMIEPIADANDVLKDNHDNGTDYSKIFVNSKAAGLIAATNGTEVNAISWNYSDYTADTDKQVPLGWTNGNGDDIRISANHTTNAGLKQLSQYMCLNINNDEKAAIYGETPGYTMPLKGSTVYKLTFSYAGWGVTSGTPTIVIKDGEGMQVKNETLKASSVVGNSTDTPWTSAAIVFKTNEAGDYTLSISKEDNRTAFGDLSLLKAGTESVTVSDAGFATYVSDFDLDYTDVTGVIAYKATEKNDNTVTFTKVFKVPAGEGVLLRANEGSYNVPVTVDVVAWAGEDNIFVRGTGEAVASEDGPNHNYILNKKGDVVAFYKANGQTVATNHAYLQTTVDAARLTIGFDDQTTGISTIQTSDNKGAIYNLNGQRVENVRKGLYIHDGKKVVIK